MRRNLLLAGVLLPFLGCATELHVITPITHIATEGVDEEVTINPDTGTEGVWLARSVYETKGIFYKVRKLRTIEILFCPMKKNDFSDCRQGVGWSSTTNPLAGN